MSTWWAPATKGLLASVKGRCSAWALLWGQRHRDREGDGERQRGKMVRCRKRKRYVESKRQKGREKKRVSQRDSERPRWSWAGGKVGNPARRGGRELAEMAPEPARLSPRRSHGWGGRPQPSVPIQLWAGRILGLLLIKVPLLLIPRHDVQVVEVGVVVHSAAGGGGLSGAGSVGLTASHPSEELGLPRSKATCWQLSVGAAPRRRGPGMEPLRASDKGQHFPKQRFYTKT